MAGSEFGDPLKDSRVLAPGLALIFDMDGVIVDSNPLHREAWTEFNLRYGVKTTDEMLRRMYGKHNSDIVRDYFGADLSADEVAARGASKEALYREMAAARLDRMLVPGVREFVAAYYPAPMGIASNGEPDNVTFVLEKSGLRSFFGAVADGSQVTHPKPHPEVFLRVAGLLGVAPENCIVFEDSPTGVDAGVAAGMRVVGLCTTYGDLPGTSIAVNNFCSGDLRRWLASQAVAHI
jgi:beta-phosphoglucomutase family hydrolase